MFMINALKFDQLEKSRKLVKILLKKFFYSLLNITIWSATSLTLTFQHIGHFSRAFVVKTLISLSEP